MSSTETTAVALDSRIERYRRTERAFWERYGLEPTERFVEIPDPAVRVRIVEVGSGSPVLFVPGAGGTGPYWAPLIRELTGFRCLLLDRPGWGLSAPVDYTKQHYSTLVAEVLRGVLDALDVDRAPIVGQSIGNLWALRLAQRHPSRTDACVLLAGFPAAEVAVPTFPKLLASPAGALIVRIPARRGMLMKQLRGLGHAESLDAGRIPDEFFTWRTAFQNDTDSMRGERAMVQAIVGRKGFKPGLVLDQAECAALEQPVRMIYGAADPVGSVDVWERFVAPLQEGDLKVVPGAGHVPWLDDAQQVGRHVTDFLTRREP